MPASSPAVASGSVGRVRLHRTHSGNSAEQGILSGWRIHCSSGWLNHMNSLQPEPEMTAIMRKSTQYLRGFPVRTLVQSAGGAFPNPAERLPQEATHYAQCCNTRCRLQTRPLTTNHLGVPA